MLDMNMILGVPVNVGLLPGGVGDRAGDQCSEIGSLTQKQIQYIMMVSYRHEWCGRFDNIGQYYD
jgi:hypothetical protein